ncbi:MAG: AraC family transcriptional regulator [Clostridia bacterium]
MEAINWMDQPTNDGGRIIFTESELHVPGLRMFGKHHTQKAIPALQLHYHKNCFEMTYLTKGTLHFSIDERSYNLSGGDLFVTHPNEIHDTAAVPLSVHSMYWFQLDVSDPARFFYLEKGAAMALITQLNALDMRVVKLDEQTASAILTGVYDYFCSPHQSTRDMGAALLLYFLHLVVFHANQLRFTLQPDIGRVANYIIDHLDDELSLEELADIAQLSVSRFKQKFKNQIGVPPREFINAQRVKAGEALLEEGWSVTDTAMELGFSSSNYFAVVFRRHMGYSPMEVIRRKHVMQRQAKLK